MIANSSQQNKSLTQNIYIHASKRSSYLFQFWCILRQLGEPVKSKIISAFAYAKRNIESISIEALIFN